MVKEQYAIVGFSVITPFIAMPAKRKQLVRAIGQPTTVGRQALDKH